MDYLSLTIDRGCVTDEGIEVPAGTVVSYLGHVLGGMIKIRWSGAEHVIDPNATLELGPSRPSVPSRRSRGTEAGKVRWLIAAAPDLLAACRELRGLLVAHELIMDEEPPGRRREAIERADAAIAKATGVTR